MASIVSAGTTSATALNMSADTSGVLQLASNNGTVALTVSTAQAIGMGTTSPAYPLDISASTTFAPTLRITSSGSESGVQLNTTSSGGRAYTLISGGATGSFSGGKFGLYDSTAGLGRLWVTSAGKVGVNSAAPVGMFEVQTNTGVAPYVQQNGSNNGKMFGKVIGNGGTGGQTIKLFDVTGWQSSNTRMFGRVTVIAASATSNQGNVQTAYFGRAYDGTSYTSSFVAQGDWGTMGLCSLSWAGTTANPILNLVTVGNVYGFMSVDVEYCAGDGVYLAFAT